MKESVKPGEVILSVTFVVIACWQIIEYATTDCFTAFAELPMVCVQNRPYVLVLLIAVELLYPILILRKKFQ